MPDSCDAIWDDVIGTCLACGISMQQRLLFIKQDPFDIRVIHVLRTNLNRGQVGAAVEGINPDVGDAITNRDAR